MQLDDCLFCRIARGEIPAAKVYEDDEVLAFKDIHPKAPVHFLIIPKKHIQSLAHAEPEDNALLGKMLGLTRKLAMQEGAVNGFRVIINTGRDGGQEVDSCSGRSSALDEIRSKKWVPFLFGTG